MKDFSLLATIVLSIDSLYLYMIKDLFNTQVQTVQGRPLQLDMKATILDYILIITGIWYLLTRKGFSHKEMFFMGIFSYGIYELTSKALLKNWKWETVAIDTIWGGVLFYLVSYIYKESRSFFIN